MNTSRDAGASGDGDEPSRFSLGFIEDDYDKALADARAKGRPIFIDVWATWCHTCLSLKNFVLTDSALSEHKEAFTWLAIDSEKPGNAALVERLGLKVLPTLWVIDAKTEKPIWTWNGALTAAELTSELQAARATPGARGNGNGNGNGNVKTRIAQAHAAIARGRPTEAITLFRAALASRVPFAERARAADVFVSLLAEAKSFDECATVASREGPGLPEGTYRVDVAVTAVGCVADAKPDSVARKRLPGFIDELRALTSSTSKAVLVDDRSSAFDALVAALKTAGDKAAVTKAASDWATMLEGAAAKAKSPRERAVFDAHRLSAYLELGEPARALPMLEASERDFPEDYNPSARRARALFELGRHEEALASADSALSRAYGGRRLRIYMLKADIFEKAGDPGRARGALTAALEDTKGVPLRAGYKRLRESVADRLRAAQPPTLR